MLVYEVSPKMEGYAAAIPARQQDGEGVERRSDNVSNSCWVRGLEKGVRRSAAKVLDAKNSDKTLSR